MTTLTNTMQPVLDAIGFDATITLVAALGGTRQVLSAPPGPYDAVARLLGADAAARLVSAIGAGPLDIPRCLSWMLARRNEEICARYLAGETQAELALRFRLTERHVRNIVASQRDPSATTQGERA